MAGTEQRYDEERVRHFVQHFGALMAASGMPGLAGHVFACLLADPDGRMTGRELGDFLQISPAAVSTATTYLHHVGLTRKMREPGSRHIVHALISDDWYASLTTRTNVMKATQATLEEGADAAGGPDTLAGRRLWLNAKMFGYLGTELTTALAAWEHKKAELLADLPEVVR